MIEVVVWIAMFYLIGSISSAVLVCHLFGLPDPRTAGSCNAGATNVLRLYGKKPAAITLAADMTKGFLPLLCAHLFSFFDDSHLLLLGAALVVGHMYPAFFGFRGGKGVATWLGALAAWDLWHLNTIASIVATWLFVAGVSRRASAASITAVVLAPLYTFLWRDEGWSTILLVAALSALVLWGHRGNVIRLLAGKEDRIGSVMLDKNKD